MSAKIGGNELLWIFAGVLAGWFCIIAAMIWYGSELILHPPWHESTASDHMRTDDQDPLQAFGIPFQEVAFPSTDGLTLHGWWIPGNRGATAGIVTAHGVASDRRDFLRHIPMLHDAGYPVLLFDARNHGSSAKNGEGISYGVRESSDVISAVHYAKQQRHLERVLVLGTSQGAVSAILAAAKSPLIDAVIGENPYTRIEDLLQDTSMMRSFPGQLSAAIMRLALWRMGSATADGAIDHVGKIAPRPLLLIHSKQDRVLAYGHSQRIVEAANHPNAEIWLPEKGAHSHILDANPERYRAVVLGFIRATIGQPNRFANSATDQN